jgi:hypothetical protein
VRDGARRSKPLTRRRMAATLSPRSRRVLIIWRASARPDFLPLPWSLSDNSRVAQALVCMSAVPSVALQPGVAQGSLPSPAVLVCLRLTRKPSGRKSRRACPEPVEGAEPRAVRYRVRRCGSLATQTCGLARTQAARKAAHSRSQCVRHLLAQNPDMSSART